MGSFGRSLVRPCAALLACIGLLAANSRAAEQTVQIQLKPSATVSKPVVTLEDIALIEGGGTAIRQQIGRLDITEIELAPASDTVTESQVELRLSLAGIDPQDYDLSGASRTHITRSHAQVNDLTVIGAVRDPLALAWKVDPSAIRIRLTKPLSESLKSMPSVPEARLEPFIREGLLPGRFRISIGVYDGEELVHTFSVPVETSVRKRVAIVQGRLRPQHLITAEDIRIEEQDLTGRTWLTVPDVVISRMTSRWLRDGQVIRKTDLYRPDTGSKPPELVRRNSLVRLVARKRGLRVTVRGAVLVRDSRVGETVQAVNPSSQQTVVGRLVSPTEVEVPF